MKPKMDFLPSKSVYVKLLESSLSFPNHKHRLEVFKASENPFYSQSMILSRFNNSTNCMS